VAKSPADIIRLITERMIVNANTALASPLPQLQIMEKTTQPAENEISTARAVTPARLSRIPVDTADTEMSG